MQNPIPMKSNITAENVARYVNETITTESDLERRLRLETLKLPESGMISSSDVGAYLALMALTVNAKNALEIGTFTGYTALKVASVLPTDGKLICCDISSDWAKIGMPFWKEAHVHKKIELKIAPASETLQSLIDNGKQGAFDFAFIDADKTGYDGYYECCLKLLRPGGLIILDNMLWSGRVANPAEQDQSTIAIRNLNQKISLDPRVSSCLLTVGDGLMLARKK